MKKKIWKIISLACNSMITSVLLMREWPKICPEEGNYMCLSFSNLERFFKRGRKLEMETQKSYFISKQSVRKSFFFILFKKKFVTSHSAAKKCGRKKNKVLLQFFRIFFLLQLPPHNLCGKAGSVQPSPLKKPNFFNTFSAHNKFKKRNIRSISFTKRKTNLVIPSVGGFTFLFWGGDDEQPKKFHSLQNSKSLKVTSTFAFFSAKAAAVMFYGNKAADFFSNSGHVGTFSMTLKEPLYF